MPLPLQVGVGQNEQAVTPVACADFSRRLDARSNPEAHALKVAGDVCETKGEMARHVFKEAPFRPGFGHDAGDVRPEVPGIARSLAQAREGEGLTGITGRDEMYAPAPRSAIEGSQIVPDRSRSQGRVRHPRHESGRGETVSLDIAHGAISGFRQLQAEIQSSDTGAKADAANVFMSFGGTKSHTIGPFLRAPGALSRTSLRVSEC